MNRRVLSALVGAAVLSLFANAAQARVETVSPETVALAAKAPSKPNNAKNYKSDARLVYALATTSDVAIGPSRPATEGYSKKANSRKYYSKTYASKKYASKRYASKRNGKAKSYAHKAQRRSHVASGDGGSSRSCLQPSARALLNRIEAQFGSVNVISTCRSGAVIATSGKPSKHRYGLAIDFSAPGRKAAVVQWLIANHHSGGTMTYRDMDHIHVDVGSRFVSLGANSGRG